MPKKYVCFLLVSLFCGAARADLPTVNYVDTKASGLQEQINAKADDNAVVKITGDQANIAGNKTFTNNVTVSGTVNAANIAVTGSATVPTPADNSNDTHAATTAWTNSKIDDAKGLVPVRASGSSTNLSFAQMWIEQGT